MIVSRGLTCLPVALLALVVAVSGCQPGARSAAGPAAVSTTAASGSQPASSQPGSTPTSAEPGSATTSAKPGSSSSPDDAVNQVLAISIDGLNPLAIQRLGVAKTPAFHRLMREGAWTFNARTERELTRTLPNHTGMLTGRRVDARHGGHGVTFNSDNGSTVHKAAGHYVASVFDVVHDRGGRTAMFASKPKFALYQRTWNTHGAKDRVGKDQGRAKIDRFTVDENETRLVGKLNAELRRSPREFTFLHLALPDLAGHAHGFMGTQYLEAVRQTDKLLATVLKTIADKPSLRRHELVMLTADHGGIGPSHSDPAALQDYRVPFMVWGPGVPAGRNLYSLNPAFRSPGSSRTTYSGVQPIRNGDVANLATDVLDLPKVPGSELNASRKLNVFIR